MNKDFKEECIIYDIQTRGAQYAQMVGQLSVKMRNLFARAADNMEVESNRRLVQAVFDLYNQAYSLGVTEILDDKTILAAAREV